ncbi:MAG: hypothetical protein KIT17_05225 [Rubrivivax sp.]|nr:hypothetical protein [Rubrivivax sp.]
MNRRHQSFDLVRSPSWQAHVMPALIVAAVVSTLLGTGGPSPGEGTAAEAAGPQTPHHAMLLAPSPAPGEGEPDPMAEAVHMQH